MSLAVPAAVPMCGTARWRWRRVPRQPCISCARGLPTCLWPLAAVNALTCAVCTALWACLIAWLAPETDAQNVYVKRCRSSSSSSSDNDRTHTIAIKSNAAGGGTPSPGPHLGYGIAAAPCVRLHALRRRAERRHPLIAHTARAQWLVRRQPLRLKLGAARARRAVARPALQPPHVVGASWRRLSVGLVRLTPPARGGGAALAAQLAPTPPAVTAIRFDCAVVTAQHPSVWDVVKNGGRQVAPASRAAAAPIEQRDGQAAPVAGAGAPAAGGAPLQHRRGTRPSRESPLAQVPPGHTSGRHRCPPHRDGAGVAGTSAGIEKVAVAARRAGLPTLRRRLALAAAGAGAARAHARKRRPACLACGAAVGWAGS